MRQGMIKKTIKRLQIPPFRRQKLEIHFFFFDETRKSILI